MPSVISSRRRRHPGQLARKLVRAEEEDLRHVDEHDGDHEVRSPAVQGANEPAERDLVIQRLQAVPRLAGGRHIDQRQQNPVTICSRKTISAALPKTYHQLAVLRGTGCSAASRIGAASCRRWSNHSATCGDQAHGGPLRRVSALGPRSSASRRRGSSACRLHFVAVLEQAALRRSRRRASRRDSRRRRGTGT